jgi:protein TonB
MFEDSLLESQGRLVSKSRRWITAGSIGLQCLIAAAIVIVPMVKPEALPFTTVAPAVFVPLKKPPVVVKVAETHAAASAAAAPMREILRPPILTRAMPDPGLTYGPPPPDGPVMMTSMVGPVGGSPLGVPGGTGPNVVVAKPEHTGPVKVSSGVSSGMLISQIQPVYPRIAIASRTEGVVVIEAIISKSGTIESAHVISGPAMLAGAAIDAVRSFRYRPYRLNGEVTEVQTTVTVNFKLGS